MPSANAQVVNPLLPIRPLSHGFGSAAVWLGLLALAGSGPALMYWLGIPWEHLSRVGLGSMLLAISLAIVWFHPARDWGAPLRLGLCSLALALAAWVFLPAVNGGNLFAAWEETGELALRLRTLPIGDRAGFEREQERRALLKKGFPELAWRLQRAEAKWTQETSRAIAALTSRVQSAQSQIHELWQRERYEEMDAVCSRVWNDCHKDAERLDQVEALRDFCDYYKGAVLLARRAGKVHAEP
jgi:hypothetical protein